MYAHVHITIYNIEYVLGISFEIHENMFSYF